MKTDTSILDRLYAMEGGPEVCRDIYADWAKNYDSDTVDGMGYVGPALVAEALFERVSPAARILDAGCGTGLAGEQLAARGFLRVDGIDVSPDMLRVARGKNVYRSLREADLTAPIDLPDNSYDGAVCVGVFTNGHVGPAAFDELARVVRPGGTIVATVHENVWQAEGYPAHLEALAESGAATVIAAAVAPYHLKENYSCRLCVLEAA
tara:strand:- start:757 stop:1380 length:624 start_codon:yes stop_codon:yes gene_type:complete